MKDAAGTKADETLNVIVEPDEGRAIVHGSAIVIGAGTAHGERMNARNPWLHCLRLGLLPGSVAGVLSALALGVCGKREIDDPIGPLNAPSQWLFGPRATYLRGLHMPHTLVGYLTHHASAIFWAAIFQRWLRSGRRESPAAVPVAAVGTAAVAFAVDYGLTPKRLRPGFENVLSKKAMFAFYAAIAVGLLAGECLRNGRHVDR